MMRGAVSTDWPTGYIGLYENHAIFAFTIIALTVFPIIPLIVNLRLKVDHVQYFAWMTLFVALSGGVASAIVLTSIRRRREARELTN
jgi:hypothetical protein